ncbi:MAG: energy-coupling factor ABC transporter ATP-binding protein [Clostridiales bacterium]|jgi:energy-coupling factor transport system ATP-binding protein|nr:energy-coupling factor ABC transporter ATP-binding protein [Clostridiales bacterium]
MAFIELQNVSFEYPGGFLAVDDIDIRIEQGENVAIAGQNGAGKTTAVKMCNGLLRPTKGNVIVDGINSKERTTAEISRVVGYVFQNPDDQIFHSTVLSEVEFGPKMMKMPAEKAKALIDYALRATGMYELRDENPYNLPLSVRKFVTIASIIAMDTKALIFDEPTAGQDLNGTIRLRNILGELREKGKTLVTITHDMEFVADNFSRLIVMANKKVVADGSPKEIFWDFPTLLKAKLKQPYVSRICNTLSIGSNVISMDDAVSAVKDGMAAHDSA